MVAELWVMTVTCKSGLSSYFPRISDILYDNAEAK